jgi:hypothetical protein
MYKCEVDKVAMERVEDCRRRFTVCRGLIWGLSVPRKGNFWSLAANGNRWSKE